MNRRQTRGFTLIELIIAITVISIAVTGVLGALSALSVRSAQSLVLEQAAMIAGAYLDEISAKSFLDPDGVSGETARALFDDIQDYQGLNDFGARDQRGAVIAGLDAYTVRVAVVASALGGVPASQSRRIDVSVRHGSGAVVNLSRYRMRYP